MKRSLRCRRQQPSGAGSEKTSGLEPRSTRSALLEAAKETFASYGFEGATFSLIAERAGVNGSQINYHFQDKVHLYRTILEQSGDAPRSEHLVSVLRNATSETEFRLRLELFADELLSWYAKDELGIQIVMLEMIRGMPIGRDLIEARFSKLWSALIAFMEDARARGIIRKDVDPGIAAVSFLGIFHAFSSARAIAQKFIGVTLADDEQRLSLARALIENLFVGLREGNLGGTNERPA